MLILKKSKKYSKLILTVLGLLLCLLAYSFNIFHKTVQIAPIAATYPASDIPDSIILTIAAEPTTMQTINWRTGGENKAGLIRFRELTSTDDLPFMEKVANYSPLETSMIDDSLHSRFTVTLNDLNPGTVYEYWVANNTTGTWAEPNRFVTAPVAGQPFSFIYLGDFQVDLAATGKMLGEITQKHPETGFFMMGGDFANTGNNRNDWDQIINGAANVWANYSLAPTLGNHDLSTRNNSAPPMYLSYFNLPPNGPADLPPNRVYSFAYGDAYFFVLDSNDKLKLQKIWLEQLLQNPTIQQYKWKIVMMHHPIYNIKASRTNTKLHDTLVPIFDKYGVDLVLNAHDHGYMRSKVLKNDTEVPEGQLGTVYVITNSGGKFYNVQHIVDKAIITIGGTTMYLKIDIDNDVDGNARLSYKAYNTKHNLLDEFTLTKQH